MLDLLDKQGLLKDTAIIISADHGDAFGEHGIYTDHVNVDECTHHISLVVRWPGIAPNGSSSDNFMTNIDFAPTICDALNVPAPEQWDGISYKNNFEDNKDGEDRDFIVWDSALYCVQRAVRTKTHLFIRTYDTGEYNNWQEEELYDITIDPFQTNNLAGIDTSIVKQCRSIISNWVNKQKAKPGFVTDPIIKVLKDRGINIPEELL